VDDALDAGAPRLLHDDARALDIVVENLVALARPQAIVGRDVKDIPYPAQGPADRLSVTDVTFDELDIESGKMRARTAGADQGPHPISGQSELSRHRRADESRGAGDEGFRGAAHAAS